MKQKVIYRCTNCGAESPKWLGKCPGCAGWNTMEEMESQAKTISGGKEKKTSPRKLAEVLAGNSDRIVTDISEFNRVLGGGIVKDSLIILTARPGAGKSTLLLQVADDVAGKGCKVLYASAEESDSQIKSRAERVLPDKGKKDNIWIYAETSLNQVLASIEEIDPDLIMIDSIQTFTLEEHSSRPGSPVQTMECAGELLKVAKNSGRPRAVIMAGQMTKDDELAGLRALEHLVDAVLILSGENGEELRGAWCSKNRFGSTGEIGFFSMTEQGMLSIDNPSEYFMTQRAKGREISGSALAVIKEGTRPIIVEIESLVAKSYTPYPARIAECLRRDQLNTLISILEQRGKLNLYDKNVVVKTTGGLQLKEQAVSLAVIMSIVSSVQEKAIPGDMAFVADVGLTGELKKVPALEARIREIDRMGFRRVYVAKNALRDAGRFSKLEVRELDTLEEVIADLV